MQSLFSFEEHEENKQWIFGFAYDQLALPRGLATRPQNASFPLAAMHYLPHLTA